MSNSSIEPTERARRERIRIKLFTTVLVTYGYALLGGALWDPLTGAQTLTPLNVFLALLGLAMHAGAIYIAPRGEP